MRRNRWNQLGDLIGQLEFQSRRARGVFNGSTRGERSKSDDLRDFVLAVFVGHIFHHFVAPFVGKVHVYVGHGHTLGIQKTLEQSP